MGKWKEIHLDSEWISNKHPEHLISPSRRPDKGYHTILRESSRKTRNVYSSTHLFRDSIHFDYEVNGLLQSERYQKFLFARAHKKDGICLVPIIDAKNSYPRK